jgi:hypothetical protein
MRAWLYRYRFVFVVCLPLHGCAGLSAEDACEVVCDTWARECPKQAPTYAEHLWCSNECKRRLPDIAVECDIHMLACDDPRMVDGSCLGL